MCIMNSHGSVLVIILIFSNIITLIEIYYQQTHAKLTAAGVELPGHNSYMLLAVNDAAAGQLSFQLCIFIWCPQKRMRSHLFQWTCTLLHPTSTFRI